MNIACDVIADLLPLYHDDVCNEASKKLVDAHIAECEPCRAMLAEMNNNKLDEYMIKERENVIENHMTNIKKQSLLQGLILAMLASVIPTFAINLWGSGTLNWFYIVLSGVLLFGSLTVVPLIVTKHRGIWTLISATASLLLLLFVIESYVSGPYAARWFGVAAISILVTVGAFSLVVGVLGKKKH